MTSGASVYWWCHCSLKPETFHRGEEVRLRWHWCVLVVGWVERRVRGWGLEGWGGCDGIEGKGLWIGEKKRNKV